MEVVEYPCLATSMWWNCPELETKSVRSTRVYVRTSGMALLLVVGSGPMRPC